MAYYWNPETRQYEQQDGGVITSDKLREIINTLTQTLALAFISRAEFLRSNMTVENLQDWNAQCRRELVALHYSMATIAFGGLSQMDENKWNEAEAAILFQLSFWDNFVSTTVQNAQANQIDGNFVVRASLYALAGYSTFLNAETFRERLAGMREEHRFTTSGNPCIDCRTEEAKGWVAIGSTRAIGDSVCMMRCRCWRKYR